MWILLIVEDMNHSGSSLCVVWSLVKQITSSVVLLWSHCKLNSKVYSTYFQNAQGDTTVLQQCWLIRLTIRAENN